MKITARLTEKTRLVDERCIDEEIKYGPFVANGDPSIWLTHSGVSFWRLLRLLQISYIDMIKSSEK